MGLGRTVNKALLPLRLRLERLPRDTFDLALYPEAQRPAPPRYLNIGSLGFPHPLWHNLDNPTELAEFAQHQAGNVHIAHDLMSEKPLPIASDSLAIVYCSHVIEHLRDPDVELLFREVARTLVPGGTFRLVAPDMDLFMAAYRRGDADAFKNALTIYPCDSIEQKLIVQFASALVPSHPATGHRKLGDAEVREAASTMDDAAFCDHFARQVPLEVQKRYPADHMNWFTLAKAIGMLERAGFKTIRRSACQQSYLPVLRNRLLFDPHADHSFYVECVK